MTPFRRFLPAFMMCASFALFSSAFSQDWAKTRLDASSRHGEYVKIQESSGRVLQAWVVYPEVKGKAPVVVMIHEIFGLTDWARLMADELAAQGYLVVEPDLLSGFAPASATSAGMSNMPGMAPADPVDHLHPAPAGKGEPFVAAMPGGTGAFPDQGSAVKAVSGLDPVQVMTDLQAAANYGKSLPAASGKLFAAGFCWGGGKTFEFATVRKDLSGAFVFYGPPPPNAAMAMMTTPVYGFYGENDARIGATIPATVTAMKAAGKFYEPVIYAGAGHGFMRSGQAPDAKPEDAAAYKDGFSRLLKELKTK